jgi:hypothetical protein
LFLCAEKIIEAIALVESEVALLVVGINKQETAASLIERVNKPSLYETENVAAKMSALEIDTYSQTANHDSGIAAVLLFTGDVLFYLLLTRTRNLLDAVIGEGKCGTLPRYGRDC